MPSNESFRPRVVSTILIACLAVFLLQMSGQLFLISHFALWPPGPRVLQMSAQGPYQLPPFEIWQVFSYAFLHGGFAHLFFNMFGLWMFGRAVEFAMGPWRFAIYYGVCVLGAALAQILAARYSGEIVPTIGASGGVLGLLPAFAILYPKARIQLLFPPIAMRAPVFVLVYGVIELSLGLTDTLPGIAHFAHLGGMLFGLVLLIFWINAARQKARQIEPFNR